jgi:hypothetical protein
MRSGIKYSDVHIGTYITFEGNMGHKQSGTVTIKYPKGVVLVTDCHLLWWADKESILKIGKSNV